MKTSHVGRRTFLELGGCAVVASALRPAAILAAPSFDLVIRGGLVLAGTGVAAYPADVGKHTGAKPGRALRRG